MKWYGRMLLSYVPMLFILISSLIFFSFMALVAASEHNYIETNQAILERIAYQADASLLLTERNAVSRLMTDKALQQFFSDRSRTAFEDFQTQQALLELKASLPFHSSIYVYSYGDRRVLSDEGSYSVEEFPDRAFIQAHEVTNRQDMQAAPLKWTAPRVVALPISDSDEHSRQAVSLVKLYQVGPFTQGAMIINVYTDAITQYVNSFNESVDVSIHIVYGPEGDQAVSSNGEKAAMMVSQAQSEYTGWLYRWDGGHGTGYAALSLASRLCLGLALLTMAVALAGFTLAVHKRPEQLVEWAGRLFARTSRGQSDQQAAAGGNEDGERSRAHELEHEPAAEFWASASQEPSVRREGATTEGGSALPEPASLYAVSGVEAVREAADEFTVEISKEENGREEEERLLRSQWLYHDLLAGHVILTDEQFVSRMTRLQRPHAFDRLGVFTAEIDGQHAFTEHYSAQGRQLFKYVMEQSLQELADQHRLISWQVWMEPHRLACVVYQCRQASEQPLTLGELAAAWQAWIGRYLKMSVSIGIGADSNSIETIAESYRNARDNLALKPVFGAGAIIDNKLGSTKSSLDSYTYLQALEGVVRSLRRSEGEWQGKLSQWFAELRERRVMKQELHMLVHSVALQLEKELSLLHPSIQHQWKEVFIHRFAELKERVETLAELEEQMSSELSALACALEQEREARQHHHLALQAKSYIDLHFTEPSLSLASVSAWLNLRPSALSQIFKEELGIKFVDYVIRVRLDHAKRMLAETDEPIQRIAEQSGYPNLISFYRAFKKVLDIPPGEYRSVYRAQT